MQDETRKKYSIIVHGISQVDFRVEEQSQCLQIPVLTANPSPPCKYIRQYPLIPPSPATQTCPRPKLLHSLAIRSAKVIPYREHDKHLLERTARLRVLLTHLNPAVVSRSLLVWHSAVLRNGKSMVDASAQSRLDSRSCRSRPCWSRRPWASCQAPARHRQCRWGCYSEGLVRGRVLGRGIGTHLRDGCVESGIVDRSCRSRSDGGVSDCKSAVDEGEELHGVEVCV